MHTLPLPHTVRLGDGRTLRATGSAGSFVTAWLLEPTVNSTCVLAVTASWSVRVYVAARETHGRVCPLSYLLPVVCMYACMYLLIRATGGIRLTASGFGDRSAAGGGRGGAPRRARSCPGRSQQHCCCCWSQPPLSHFGALWCGCRRRPLTIEHPPLCNRASPAAPG